MKFNKKIGKQNDYPFRKLMNLKAIFSLVLICTVTLLNAQSFTLTELKSFVKNSQSESERLLIKKNWQGVEQKKMSNGSTVIHYQKGNEGLFLGLVLTNTSGQDKRHITYMLIDIPTAVSLLLQIKNEFTYKSDRYDESQKGKYILVENSEYAIQVFMPDNQTQSTIFTINEQ